MACMSAVCDSLVASSAYAANLPGNWQLVCWQRQPFSACWFVRLVMLHTGCICMTQGETALLTDPTVCMQACSDHHCSALQDMPACHALPGWCSSRGKTQVSVGPCCAAVCVLAFALVGAVSNGCLSPLILLGGTCCSTAAWASLGVCTRVLRGPS